MCIIGRGKLVKLNLTFVLNFKVKWEPFFFFLIFLHDDNQLDNLLRNGSRSFPPIHRWPSDLWYLSCVYLVRRNNSLRNVCNSTNCEYKGIEKTSFFFFSLGLKFPEKEVSVSLVVPRLRRKPQSGQNTVYTTILA